ncbi:MAG: iron-sulfur cluster assembly accessory protein [Rhodocyclaceae bacterium]|nr:iron-sulfur cluster assembly accessory protein [Rhodocyclaceae bacterium]
MISLTPTAINAVRRFLETTDEPIAGLRISVAGGGCAGLQYGLKLERQGEPDDHVLDFDGLSVLIDPFSAPLLAGTTVDFVESLEGSGFKFENPQANKSCACGQSFTA